MVSSRSLATAPISIGQRAFRNQLAGAGADDADAEHAFRAGLDHELGEAVGAIDRERAAGRGPGELRDLDLLPLLLRLGLGEARPRQLRDR